MTKGKLVKERERLLAKKHEVEEKLKIIDELLAQDNPPTQQEFQVALSPWEDDPLWVIADIIRTSPIVNPNYPHGYSCKICNQCGNECTSEGDGWECNWAFMDYFKDEIAKRNK